MSAASASARSPSPCACTNISLMQLFHELKQKFPGVPDHVVSNTIELYCHDKQACETHLHSEVKASLTHAYHASSLAAARQLNEQKVQPPLRCRNQPILKHEAVKTTAVKSITCQTPQTAVISSGTITNDNKVNTDANQNVVEPDAEENKNVDSINSPVAIVNIDNCYAKYSADSPSDLELTNENTKEDQIDSLLANTEQENRNYRLLKSNKVTNSLNERLEKGKEKKTIKKEENKEELLDVPQEKPKRPNTLDFRKPNPDIAFKPTLREPEADKCRTISPAPPKQESQPAKDTPTHKPERGYPLNVSVNVNCHMDLSRPYGDPWLEDYESPRAITSVNLTLCTPTSNMASPVREARDDDGAFEGHVTVTVSPSTTRPPRRRAPPPPQSHPSRIESPRPARPAPEPPESSLGGSSERSLIERQRERLNKLAKALDQEKGRLAQLARETQILKAPPPSPLAAQRLRECVEQLRDKCDSLAKRLEMRSNEPEESANFYSNIYTGQRPPSSWECHLCTFRNHPLLDKCEECDMPRILVGTSPFRTQDSGFGSFRDRNRKLSQTNVTEVVDPVPLMPDCRPLSRLNC